MTSTSKPVAAIQSPVARLGVLVGLAAALSIMATDFAGAQESSRQRRNQRESRSQREPKAAPVKREAALAKPVPVGTPPDPLVAVISLPSQRVNVYGSTGVIAESKVSTGQSGFRTPTGVFSILQRNRYHESNIYSGAPMPFMQRLTWSGIALHQGVVPGYPASHGCIRLPGEFANRMWGIGRVGMRVIVTPSDVAPQSIEHARLPVPVMTPVPAGAAPIAVLTASVAAATTEGEQRLLDPYRLAHARKLKAAADQIAAEKAVKPAFDLAILTSAEASRASDELRGLERGVADLEEQVAERRLVIQRSQTADDDSEQGRALTQLASRLEQAQAELVSAKASEAAKSDAAFAAAKAAREAETLGKTSVDDTKRANAGTEPVSIFVSKKEGRVFVRQGFVPIHDEPIAIAEPERPLGTHVFTAIDARDGGAALRWIVVTVPSNPPEAVAEKPKKKGAREPVEAPRPALPASNAAGTLERFELPEATKKLVAERVWPGASLMVSDFGISGETGRGTDFVVLTK